MTAPSVDFDAAIEQALEQSRKLDSALTLLEQLTAQLAKTVAAKTDGLVSVALVPADNFTTSTLGTLARAMEMYRTSERKRYREVGDDDEDKQFRQFVLASSGKRTNRVLWEVTLSSSDGFPITIRGPEEDETVSCFAEEDIRAEFLKAASHGLVGRKIAALHRHAIARREREAAAARAELDRDDDGVQPTGAGSGPSPDTSGND